MKNFLLFIASIVLAVIFSPWLGSLYEFIIGRPVGSTILGIGNTEYLEGFVIGFIFFITLLLWSFGTGMKKYVIIFSIIPFLVIAILSQSGWLILVSITAIIIAFILAQIILISYKKLKK